jgi:hypothetical protein
MNSTNKIFKLLHDFWLSLDGEIDWTPRIMRGSSTGSEIVVVTFDDNSNTVIISVKDAIEFIKNQRYRYNNLRLEIKKILREQFTIDDDIDVVGGIENIKQRVDLILNKLKNKPNKKENREEIEQLYEDIKSVYDFVIDKW